MDTRLSLLVKNILEHPSDFSWSTQGLGMMRLYLSTEVRLHIWDSRLRVPGVSAIHTHPWDLESTVVAGRYRQYRYVELNEDWQVGQSGTGYFQSCVIQCGKDAAVKDDPVRTILQEKPIEIYDRGESYREKAEEIHLSCPEDGTVTLVQRTFKKDTEHARVFWRGTGGWVDAKPRDANAEEIAAVTQHALQTWF